MRLTQQLAGLTLAILAFGMSSSALKADDWPQWGGPDRDLRWKETGLVTKLPEKLTYRWKAPLGEGYAGPAVSGDLVFVTDRVLGEGQKNPANPFANSAVEGVERVWCLNVKTGEKVWQKQYPCEYTLSYPYGPRTTPTVDGDVVYTLGAMGDLICWKTEDGSIVWKKNLPKEFNATINNWGYASSPLVDGDNLIVLAGGMPDSCLVALNKKTGEKVWNALSSKDFGYGPPIIIEEGGKRQLIIWTPTALNSLDPKTGKVYWNQPFDVKFGLTAPMPIFDKKNHLLFVTAFYNGPMMMELSTDKPQATLKWKGKSNSEIKTDGLHSIMPTPYFDNGYLYGIGSYGQLRGLKADTGERLWESFKATGKGRWWNAFLIPNGDRTILCNEQGDLIFAKLTPKGYEEIDRVFMIEPTNKVQRRKIVWSHPAFAQKCIFARNDKEIVCVDLSKDGPNDK